MSGLILGSDLEQKFGKNYPTPIIDEVRIRDTQIEIDVSIYFAIPAADDEADSFIEVYNNSQDNIIILSPDREGETYDRKLSAIAYGATVGQEDGATRLKEFKDYTELNKELFTEDGKRYARQKYIFIINSREPYGHTVTEDGISFDSNLAVRFLCLSRNTYDYVSELIPAAMAANFSEAEGFVDKLFDEESLINFQGGDVTYLNILNNGVVNTDKIDVFTDQNGEIYLNEVLYSLGGDYHKAINFTKNTIEAGVKKIVSSYSEANTRNLSGRFRRPQNDSLEDSINNILLTLESEMSSPKLLQKLNQINKLSPYKSSSEPVGKFYKDLNTLFFEFNKRIVSQERLERRQYNNIDILDFRPYSQVIPPASTAGDPLIVYPLINDNIININSEMCVRSLQQVRGMRGSVEGCNMNDTVFSIDNDKALLSFGEISKFVDVTQLKYLLGNSDINNFFYPHEVTVYKRKKKIAVTRFDGSRASEGLSGFGSPSKPSDKFGGSYATFNSADNTNIAMFRLDTLAKSYVYELFDRTNHDSLFRFERIGGSSASQGILFDHTSFLVERLVRLENNSYSINGEIQQRDIRFYNLLEGGDALTWDRDYNYFISVKFKDYTMIYYDFIIRRQLQRVLQDLERYLEIAEDFCSFNNIDGKFNNFFKDAIVNQFSEPYPWNEGPYYYHFFKDLRLFSPFVSLSREQYYGQQRTINFSSKDIYVRDAFNETDKISPSTGTLSRLQHFVDVFKDFVNNRFLQGVGLDQFNDIYIENSDYELKTPFIEHTKTRKFTLPKRVYPKPDFFDVYNYGMLTNFPRNNGGSADNTTWVPPGSRVYEFFRLDEFKRRYFEYGGHATFVEIFSEVYKVPGKMNDPHVSAFDRTHYTRKDEGNSVREDYSDLNFQDFIDLQLTAFFNTSPDFDMFNFDQDNRSRDSTQYSKMFSLLYITYLCFVEDFEETPFVAEGIYFITVLLLSQIFTDDEYLDWIAELRYSGRGLEALVRFADIYFDGNLEAFTRERN